MPSSPTRLSPSMAKVVIIDDHAAIVEMMTTVIETLTDHKIVGFALTAEGALEVCRTEQPDVVILDLVLANSSGIELLQDLKKHCPHARVLVFSGNLTLAAIRSSLAAGVDGIVEKMSSLSVLRTALEAVAAGKIYFSPHVSEQITELVRRPKTAGVSAALSKREKIVLLHLARGLSSKEIAAELGISPNTVNSHRYNLMHKIGLRRASQLSLYAAQAGLISDSPLESAS